MTLKPGYIMVTREELMIFEEMEAEEEEICKEVMAMLGLEASGVMAGKFGTRDGWKKVGMMEELNQKQCDEKMIQYVALIEDMRKTHHKCIEYLQEDIKFLKEQMELI